MEKVDVVNDSDVVIDTQSWEDVAEKKLLYRSVHVLVFNSKGEMLLCKGVKEDPYAQKMWSSSVYGVVLSGEDYEEAAKRILREVLSVKSDLDFLSKELSLKEDGERKFFEIYKVKHDGPFEVNKDVIENCEFMSIKKIRRLKEEGEGFDEEFAKILKTYYRV